MAHGYKTIETRSWQTQYMGPVAIHASKSNRSAGSIIQLMKAAEWSKDQVERFSFETLDWPFGKIIAVGRLISCVPTMQMRIFGPQALSRQEIAFGNYAAGRFAWIFKDIYRLKVPIPARGALGLWTVPEDIAAKVMAA